MKKTAIAVFALILMSLSANAEVFVGVKGGIGASDDNVRDLMNGDYSYSDRDGIIGAEIGYDFNSGHSSRIGVKVGLNSFGKIDSEDKTVHEDLLLKNTITVPLTVYYKYAPNETGVHFWIGGGATWASLKFQNDIDNLSGTETEIFPHAAAGVEWRIVKLIGVGLDVGYNFDAKISNNGMYRDFTGLEGFAGVKIYFF
ncbi:hypothetical protein Emin_0990 [Elusimicrobium minutum Pei191]|uniref:Outer membrane protein beta-barrel domain-containing protein n=1 Tax=Elusimicrobium minutum (strain Pei191) TaxID=445932 RepID=B2KDE7_ELUMP|nr:outer membrane beta-barrel protein [Elusimicrobium minutum]ACC98543.1 hypothetical protein Emin_0990 [Elusimicrobium minutum Pei191]